MPTPRIIEKKPFEPITCGVGDDHAPVVYTLRPGLQGAGLIYTRAGAAWFECNGETWHCKPRDLLLLLPPKGGHIRYGTLGPSFRWQTLWAHFEPRPHWFPWFTWPRVSAGVSALHLADDGDPDSRHIRRLFTAACEKPPRGFDERYHAIEGVLLACRGVDPNSRATRDERLQRAADHITLHFAEPITLLTLTQAAGVSASQLARLFIKHVGMSPRDFVELVRIRHANHLLSHTDLPVHEIARRCGFADAHYFSNRYKLFHGAGPRDVRNSNARNAHKKRAPRG